MVLIGALIFICIIGYLLVTILCPELAWQEKVSLAYGVGMGCTALLMFLMLSCKLLYSQTQLLTVLLLLSVTLFIWSVYFKKTCVLPWNTYSSKNLWYRSFLWYAIIVCLFIMSFIFSYYYPVLITDGIDYEASGKLLALTRHLGADVLFRPYPPLVPLLYSYIYFFGGTHPKIILPFFYLSLLGCFYWRLRALGVAEKPSMIFTVILATTPYLWWHSFLGILNLTSAYYFSIATFFWFSHLKDLTQWRGEGTISVSYPLMAGFFYGFSVFSRLEMLAYVCVPVAISAYSSLKLRQVKYVMYVILPSLIIAILWHIFMVFGFPSGEGFNNNLFSLVTILLLISFLMVFLLVVKYELPRVFVDTFSKFVLSWRKLLGIVFVLVIGLSLFSVGADYTIYPFIDPLVLWMRTFVTTIVIFLCGNVFYLATSCLIVLLFIGYGSLAMEQKRLCILLLGCAIVDIVIHTFYYSAFHHLGYLSWHYSVVKFIKVLVFYPGDVINSALLRGLLPLCPVGVLLVATMKRSARALEG